jgi:hypothetical protein
MRERKEISRKKANRWFLNTIRGHTMLLVRAKGLIKWLSNHFLITMRLRQPPVAFLFLKPSHKTASGNLEIILSMEDRRRGRKMRGRIVTAIPSRS